MTRPSQWPRRSPRGLCCCLCQSLRIVNQISMPLLKNPLFREAVVHEVIRNSPLIQRRQLPQSASKNRRHEIQEEEKERKRGFRRMFSGVVSSIRNVITGVIPIESSIPLTDCVAARGLTSNIPLVKCSSSSRGRYAKLAISLESNCDNSSSSTGVGPSTAKLDRSAVGRQVVEVSDKATETTPSLCQYDEDDEEGFSLENSMLEDYYDHADFDQLQCYENDFSDYYDDEEEEDEFSCVVCERAFFTSKQLERHQYRKRHWGCRMCEERFPSLILLEYHKEDEDHWSYVTDDEDCGAGNSCRQASSGGDSKAHKRRPDFEARREIMNDICGGAEEETEFGPNEEDREMLLTSARG